MNERTIKRLVEAAGVTQPQIPEAGRFLWTWFVDLGNARQYGMHGPQPIPHAEIEAWARLKRVPLRPDHVDALRRMDDAWIAAAMARIGNRDNHDPDVKKLCPASTHALTAELFDAVF